LAAAQNVSFVAQKPLLIDASIRQNILLGLRRPVDSPVSDAEGSLDVTLLPDVTDISGIDRHLQQVIELVGLELDVFRKALDCPAPVDLKETSTLKNRIGELRAATASAFSANGSTDIVAFNRQSWFPGTIGDNLLGPGGACGPEEAARVIAGLQGHAVLEDLIRMGRRRLRSERLLAAKVAHQAPALLALLPNYSKISQTTEDLDADDSAVAGLDDSTRRILLEVALSADAAGPEGTIDPQFRQSLIEARQRLAQNDARSCENWNLLNSGEMWETLTLRENLLGGRVDSRIHGAADRVDVILRKILEDKEVFSSVLLLGLEYRVGEGGKFLSGGQKQKVTIARAILKNPGILLMDEATSSLDEGSQARVVELLRDHFAGKTVVSISHRLSTIRDYDQIVVLDRGQVAQAGTYDNLVAAEGIFRDLVHQEQGGAPKPVAPALRKADVEAAKSGDGLSDLQHQLAMSDLFSNMPSEQLEFLARATKVYDFPKSQVIFRRGDPGSELFIVTAGSVTFTIEIPGATEGETPQEKIVSIFGIGKVFGELALFGNGLRTLTARAEAGTRLISLGREDLFRLMQADSGIATNLLRMLARRMVEVTDERYGVSPLSPA
jgi:ABC-type multidrug transport system ATPase subunit